jgi:hypothetical protein
LSFGHGYFVVRNLDQDQLNAGISNQGARLLEEQYFETEEPWARASRDIKSRLGSVNLQSYLSGKLAEQITNRLPDIRQQIDARLRGIEEQLKEYPEPPKQNALRIIYDVVADFSKDVRDEIMAEYPCKDWRNNWEALQRALFDALVSLKPTLATSGCKDKGIYALSLGGHSAHDAIALADSDEEEDRDDVSMLGTPNSAIPTKKRKLESTPAPSPLKQRSYNMLPGPDFSEQRTRFKLDEVERHLSETSKSRTPGQIEPRVIDALMINTLQGWKNPLDVFFNTLEKQVHSQVKNLFDKSFKKWEGTELYSAAWKITMEILNLNLQ